MGFIFVARSAKLSRWGADVGLGKNIFKVGCSEEAPDALVKQGWAGEDDWGVVKKQAVEDAAEDDVLARLGRKEKLVDPRLYPKLKGAVGIFKVKPANVENHILITRALAGQDPGEVKLKAGDFADYLIHNALRS